MHSSRRKKAPTRRLAGELDRGDAFVRDSRHGFTPILEGDVEALGEEFIWGATSNDAIAELARDDVYASEIGAVVIDVDDEDTFDEAIFG
jgi:hypothetical protein